MQNHTVPAAAEGMPTTINRRTFLRSSAGAAVLGGASVMMHAPSTEASPALLEALAEHVRATREWMARLDVWSVMEVAELEEIQRLEQAGADRAEIHQTRENFKKDTEIMAAEDAVDEASAYEHDALAAIFAFPVVTLGDLHAKLTHLSAMPGGDESFGLIQDPVTKLMRSIVGGGLV